MKTIYLTFILLFVALSGNAEETTSAVEIIKPYDYIRYEGKDSTFVIEADHNSVDKIVIRQGDRNTTIDVTSELATYCKTVELHPAKNEIFVEAYKDGKILSRDKRESYFYNDVLPGVDVYDAEQYDKNYFHSDENEEACKGCHDMTNNIPSEDEPFDDVTETTCYKCHNAKLNTSNSHAPAANWLCNVCHTGNGGEYNIDDEGLSKYLAPDPIYTRCAYCHESVDDWLASRYGHGPVNDGRCKRCHNPHGSENEFFLRKHIWNLCTTCHTEKAIPGNHIVAGFVYGRNKGAHPTKDRADPARPGREFSCTSCHNPHGSTGIYLLRMTGSQPFMVCKRCHKK